MVRGQERNIWFGEYSIDDQWISKNKKELEFWNIQLKENIETLTSLKQVQCLVTYEKIYIEKDDVKRLCEYLNITDPKFLWMLDSDRKYRKDPKIL